MDNKIVERIHEKNEFIIQIENSYKKNKSIELIMDDLKTKNMPFVQVIDGRYDMVTFIYNDSGNSENVLLMLPIVWEDLKAHLMEKISGTNLWFSTYKIRNDGKFLYRFSLNDSLNFNCNVRNENCVDDQFNPNSTSFKDPKGKDIKFSKIVLSNVKKEKWSTTQVSTNKGKLIKHKIESKILKEEREFSIHLPYAYNTLTRDLPYVLCFDAKTHLGILSSDDVLDNLMDQEEIPTTLGIFLNSTHDRSKNLKCSKEFSEFIVEELLPMIRALYNISTDPKKAFVTGVSLGGLASVYLGLTYPEVFANVLSQSGSFWYKGEKEEFDSENCWMAEQFKHAPLKDLKFYMNVGLLEGPPMIDANTNLYKTLADLNYDVDFEDFMGGHDYLSWGELFAKGLIALNKKR